MGIAHVDLEGCRHGVKCGAVAPSTPTEASPELRQTDGRPRAGPAGGRPRALGRARQVAERAAAPGLAQWRGRLPILIVLAVIVALSWQLAANMGAGGFSSDGRQNLRLSYHLWTEGTFSEDGSQPSYMREPLAIAATAAHMAFLTDIPASAGIDQLMENADYAGQILRVNLFYLIGLLPTIWWLAWLLTRSHLVATLAIVGSWWFFARISHNTGNLLTEGPAALFLVLAAGAMVWLVQTKRLRAAVLAGLMLGALALTKAAALYVALVAIPLLVLSLILFGRLPRRRALVLFAVTALAFALTVAPWMTRNYLQFGEFAIAQRGGEVLYTRAVKDGMSAEEYRGAFYAYAPPVLRREVFEDVLGFHAEDLQPGGRYERLRRSPPGEPEIVKTGDVEGAVSYFGKAKAMRIRLEKQMAAAGLPEGEADRVLREKASDMITGAPAKHLATTIPFAWRGLWSFPIRSLAAAVANLLGFAALLALPFLALWRKRPDWFAFSLMGVGMFWFYALLTHFIPRYSEPLIPLAVLAVLVVGQALVQRVGARIALWVSRRVALARSHRGGEAAAE